MHNVPQLSLNTEVFSAHSAHMGSPHSLHFATASLSEINSISMLEAMASGLYVLQRLLRLLWGFGLVSPLVLLQG